jgi:hypothetical protein
MEARVVPEGMDVALDQVGDSLDLDGETHRNVTGGIVTMIFDGSLGHGKPLLLGIWSLKIYGDNDSAHGIIGGTKIMIPKEEGNGRNLGVVLGQILLCETKSKALVPLRIERLFDDFGGPELFVAMKQGDVGITGGLLAK